MRKKRRASTRPFAWFSAFLFNVLLVAGLKFAADANVLAHGKGRLDYEASSDAIAATRSAMSRAFEQIAEEGAQADESARDTWARFVDEEIATADLTATRGFLLAAPDMLTESDRRAILVAAESDTEGTADERLIRAAKIFLPDDVRARYERLVSEATLTFASAPAVPVSDGDSLPDAPADEDEVEAPGEALDTEPVEAAPAREFFVLGDTRDLAMQSSDWLRGDRADAFQLILSGIGIAMDQDVVSYDRQDLFVSGASLLRTADRAGRLTPEFRSILEAKLYQALDPEALRPVLVTAFESSPNILLQRDAVLNAYARTVDLDELSPLMGMFEDFSYLEDELSMVGVLGILEHLKTLRDLERAKLLVRAGGDRVVALSHQLGPESLGVARTVIDWSRYLVALMVGASLCGILLAYIAVTTLGRSIFGRRPAATLDPIEI